MDAAIRNNLRTLWEISLPWTQHRSQPLLPAEDGGPWPRPPPTQHQLRPIRALANPQFLCSDFANLLANPQFLCSDFANLPANPQFFCSDFASPLAHTPTPTSTFLRDPQAFTHLPNHLLLLNIPKRKPSTATRAEDGGPVAATNPMPTSPAQAYFPRYPDAPAQAFCPRCPGALAKAYSPRRPGALARAYCQRCPDADNAPSSGVAARQQQRGN
jgi:hypothetical protein